MALELRQQLKLSQQLTLTPQLRMSLKLLQLSRLDLAETIRQELEENPTLEEIREEGPAEASEPGEEPSAAENPRLEPVKIEERLAGDIDWNEYLDEYNTPGRVRFETETRETPGFEPFLTAPRSLQDHLLWQLLTSAPDPETERIGSLVVGNLDPNGYLEVSTPDLAIMAGVTEQRVAKVLTLMQTFDPAGVCARDLTECLMIQVRHLKINNPLVVAILKHHLHHLENKRYKEICKARQVSPEKVARAVSVIRGLEPRPGRRFAEEPPRYITPDIYVHKLGDEYLILLNDDGLPRLRVNSFYRNAVRRGEAIPVEAKDYVRDKLRSAAGLIRGIHQRQKTVYRVMESILRFQREFFERGVTHLRPLVLRDVAEDLGMHESTISRATLNKYAHTPRGIFELKYFFSSPVRRVNGEAITTAGARDEVRRIIESEDARHPYSDDKIAELLKARNIDISRRTVAKYRENMRVLPSNKRKQP